MNHSESLAKLAPAFVAAQAEIENAHKNASNPHFKSTYANLAEIIDTIRPTLAKHRLAVLQIPGLADGVLTMDVMLLHESGEWISGVAGSPLGKQDPQGMGSAITYTRRYSLAALCGIAQEDDDGNATVEHKPITAATPSEDIPYCPVCNSGMWDNRQSKTKPSQPDFKCKKKGCDGVFWPGQWPPQRVAIQRERDVLERYCVELNSLALDAKDGKAVMKAAGLVEGEGTTSLQITAAIDHLRGLLSKYMDPVQAEVRSQELELPENAA